MEHSTPAPVRALVPSDWGEVRRIYEAGIATGNATFELDMPSWEVWNQARLSGLRFVAEGPDRLLGWAAVAPVSTRACYAGVVDVSVYVDPVARGRGTGTALLSALVDGAPAAGVWTLQAGVFPENEASLALHQRCGFRVVGRRERIGRLHGVWRDVLLLEYRLP